jgi:hypothetical protein
MYTLLLSISNGALWEELADEYDNVVPLGRILFALYIIFVCYGILNVVTGVFVEKTAELKLRDRDLAVHKEMALTKAFLDELRELFEMETHHNKDHANEITLARFEEQLEKNDVQMYLQTQGIDVSEAKELFVLLDVDGSGALSMDEFVYGCQRLKGAVKPLDIVRIMEQIRGLETRVVEKSDRDKSFNRNMEKCIVHLGKEVRKVRNELVHLHTADDHIDIAE